MQVAKRALEQLIEIRDELEVELQEKREQEDAQKGK